eukprot:GHRR01017075.1.p1 GENE.GHRR01017075.1~~GHRR01017075.1.p1  ORF type:complete len:534 (+),score=217.82 GHRR01017075.1:904-2505(+)
MSQLLGHLSAADLGRLACCCRGLRAVAWEAVPGLKLVLYPHQRNALSWMLHREVHGGQVMPHPFIKRLTTASGVPFYINQIIGDLAMEPPNFINDIKGGFFCDEPGLGKTVTALSLILKTQGLTPKTPQGAHTTWLSMPTGRQVGLYTNNPIADGQGGLNGAASGHLEQQQQKQRSSELRHSSSGGGSGNPLCHNNNGLLGSPGAVYSSCGSRSSLRASSKQNAAWSIAPSLRNSSKRRSSRAADIFVHAGSAGTMTNGSDSSVVGAASSNCHVCTPVAAAANAAGLQPAAAGAESGAQSTAHLSATITPSANSTRSSHSQLSSRTALQLMSLAEAAAAGGATAQPYDSQQANSPGRRQADIKANASIHNLCEVQKQGTKLEATDGDVDANANSSSSTTTGHLEPCQFGSGVPALQEQYHPAAENQDGVEHPAKRQKLQQHAEGNGATAHSAAAPGGVAAAHASSVADATASDTDADTGPDWVMCDHCHKWRRLSQGYEVGGSRSVVCIHTVLYWESALPAASPTGHAKKVIQ